MNEYQTIMNDIDKNYVKGNFIKEIKMHPDYYLKIWEESEPIIFKEIITMRNIKFELDSRVKFYEFIH